MTERFLDSRTALVTGSTAGLGYAVAEALAAAGARVVIHGLATQEEGAAAVRSLSERFGVDALFEPTDLTDTAAIEAMAARVTERFGGVDVLVNNAVLRHFAAVEDFKPADWDASIAVNLSAAFHLARLSLPGMKARGWGRIVNMSSIYGSRGAENRIDYVTTKTALLGMTRALAVELAQSGVTCNAVCPGTVPSPAILERIEAIAGREGVSVEAATRDYLAERNPTGRFVASEGVGAFIVFLCSEAARDITGATLPIDGGWQAR